MFSKIEESKASELKRRFQGEQQSPSAVSTSFLCFSHTYSLSLVKVKTKPSKSDQGAAMISLTDGERAKLEEELKKQVWIMHTFTK